MSQEAIGQRARKRRAEDARREPRRAFNAWMKPGVLIFFVALGLAVVGWALVIQAGRRIPVERAEIAGLELHLQEARWILDQMDHGENFNKPSTMMPDMPERGLQRVTVDLAFFNRSNEQQRFRGEEFFLMPELGEEVPPIGAQIGEAELGPGQALNTALHFDFDTTRPHGQLRVVWRRQGHTVYLPIPEPAEHYHLRPRDGEVAFPPEARFVQHLGRPARGAELYRGVYGCIACHGDVATPNSNNIGPHLGRIAVEASQRIAGMSAAQYVYESILEPAAFIAPECRDGAPCAEPTAMPEYASLLDLQDLADLLAFLLEPKG